MRPLRIVVVEDAPARVHGAITLALAAAALGRDVGLFFQGEAVRALEAGGGSYPETPVAGVATVAELMTQCGEMDVRLIACETGMHMSGLRASALLPGVETGGLIGFLADADAEIMTV